MITLAAPDAPATRLRRWRLRSRADAGQRRSRPGPGARKSRGRRARSRARKENASQFQIASAHRFALAGLRKKGAAPGLRREHETCLLQRVQLIPRANMSAKVFSHRAGPPTGSPEASAEIHAYIAARDIALAEAERDASDLTLNRAFLANQMVEMCLKPARSPYRAQALPATEAGRERRRCQATSARLAQLRVAFGSGCSRPSVAA